MLSPARNDGWGAAARYIGLTDVAGRFIEVIQIRIRFHMSFLRALRVLRGEIIAVCSCSAIPAAAGGLDDDDVPSLHVELDVSR